MPISPDIQSEIDERDIHRSKCLLNAAIPASLSGMHPDDVYSVKSVVFAILDSDEAVYEGVKGVLIEGDLFDAAQMLDFTAGHMPEKASILFAQAAALFAPLMTVKSIMAFEQAEKFDADLSPYRAMMARLYDRMGDAKSSELNRSLAQKHLKTCPDQTEQKAEGSDKQSLPDNVTYLSFRK